jgi:cysteine sulfinate desulfinase/cysteine desulfurase-like protein
MGVAQDQSLGTIRLSSGKYTSAYEVKKGIELIVEAIKQLNNTK